MAISNVQVGQDMMADEQGASQGARASMRAVDSGRDRREVTAARPWRGEVEDSGWGGMAGMRRHGAHLLQDGNLPTVQGRWQQEMRNRAVRSPVG